MKKLFKIFKITFLVGSIFVISGCASSLVESGGLALEQRSKEIAVDNGQTIADNNCITADAAATASAMAKAGIEPEKKMSSAQERLFMYYYEELKPECVRGKRGASVTGGRYNVSPEQLAWTEQKDVCTRESVLKRALQGREVSNVIEQGSPLNFLYIIQEDCRSWRNERRADYALKSQERRADKEAKRRAWSRFIAPYSGRYYGGSSYYGSSYYQPPRAIGIGWRATPRKSYRDSSKCTKMPGFYNCSPSSNPRRSDSAGHYSGGYGNHPGVYGQNNRLGLVYNNSTIQ